MEAELARVDASLSAAGLDVPGLGTVATLPLDEITALLGPDEALVLFVLPEFDLHFVLARHVTVGARPGTVSLSVPVPTLGSSASGTMLNGGHSYPAPDGFQPCP